MAVWEIVRPPRQAAWSLGGLRSGERSVVPHPGKMFMKARTYASVRVSRWLVLLPVYSPALGCAGCQLRYCPGRLANLIHGRVLGRASAEAYSEGITGLARVGLGLCPGLSRLRGGQGEKEDMP
jgi:hypothetical protein